MADLRIALLEDDPDHAALLRSWLTAAGHVCVWEKSTRAFIRMLSRETFDLAILDWKLPDGSGEEVLAWLRRPERESIPVIFVTSRDNEDDVAHILEAGADDYLVKPVAKRELLARIVAVTRRARPVARESDLRIGNIELEADRRAIRVGGEAIDLALKEFAIADYMLRNVGRLLSREHIYEAVWGRDAPDHLRTVDQHVSQVRIKLKLAPQFGWKISSVYQRGYRLERLESDSDRTG